MSDTGGNGDAWRAKLASLLRDQGAAAAALEDALRQERAALSEGADRELAPVVAAKDAWLRKLEAAETRRAQLLADAGLDPAEPAAWLPARAADPQQLAALWQSLLRHISECQRLNAANGRLIAHRREFIQGALNVLRGQPVQQPVYAADGRPAQGRGSRRLGTV